MASFTVTGTPQIVRTPNEFVGNSVLVNGAAVVYLGHTNGVTAANGVPLAAGATLVIQSMQSGRTIWAMCATSSDLRVDTF